MTERLIAIMFILCAVAAESVAQVCFKTASNGQRKLLSHKQWIAVGLAFYGVETIMWTLSLQRLDISAAFPMGSLCFVGVIILSKIFLKEKVTMMRWAGVAFIILGTTMIGAYS